MTAFHGPGIDRVIIGTQALKQPEWFAEMARSFPNRVALGIDDQTLADLVKLANLGLPVIASGGVTTAEDVRRLAARAAMQPKLVGAIVGRALYEGTLSMAEAVAAGCTRT